MKRILPIIMALLMLLSGISVAHAEGTLTISANVSPAELTAEGTVNVTIDVSNGEIPAESVTLHVNDQMVEELGNLAEYQTKETTVSVNITDDMFGKDIPVKATYMSQGTELTTSTSFKVAKKELRVSVVAKASANTKKITAGDTVKFTFKVENQGDVAITDASLKASPLNNGDQLTSSTFSLEPGSTKEFSYSVAISSDTTVTPILTYTANGKPYTLKLDKISIEVDSADVELTLKAGNTNITAGETVDFTLTIANTGTVDIQNIKVIDPYGDEVSINKTVLSAGSSMDVANALQVYESGELSYTVKASDKNGNDISISSNAINVTATALVGDPITIAVDYDSAEYENGKLVFNITVTNNMETAITDIKITEATLGNVGVINSLAKGSTTLTYETELTEGVTEYVFSINGKAQDGTMLTANKTVTLPVSSEKPDNSVSAILVVIIVVAVIILILIALFIVFMIRDRKNNEGKESQGTTTRKRSGSASARKAAGAAAATRTTKTRKSSTKAVPKAPRGKGDRNNM